MNKKHWYESIFEDYGQKYDNEVFAQGTLGECDFIENEINYDKSCRIVDIGCGTGRHSIELSKRGYRVTGIDLSESLLAKAREKAIADNLNTEFLKHDARELQFINKFDVAIMLCEGAFPLMETDEMNFEILKNITRSLRNNGKLIFTTLNGLFPLYHSLEEFYSSKAENENATCQNNTFDLMTFRQFSIVEIEDDFGKKKKLKCNERYYVPSEISWLLKSLGYHKVEIFGAKLGAFSRNDKLTSEDFEMLVIAEKEMR